MAAIPSTTPHEEKAWRQYAQQYLTAERSDTWPLSILRTGTTIRIAAVTGAAQIVARTTDML